MRTIGDRRDAAVDAADAAVDPLDAADAAVFLSLPKFQKVHSQGMQFRKFWQRQKKTPIDRRKVVDGAGVRNFRSRRRPRSMGVFTPVRSFGIPIGGPSF